MKPIGFSPITPLLSFSSPTATSRGVTKNKHKQKQHDNRHGVRTQSPEVYDGELVDAMAIGRALLEADKRRAEAKREKCGRRQQQGDSGVLNSFNGGEALTPPSLTLNAHRPSGRVGQADVPRIGELGVVYLGRGIIGCIGSKRVGVIYTY